MKKLIALLLTAVLFVACLAGCGTDNNAPSDNSSNSSEQASNGLTLAQLEQKGELVIATSPDFPPFEELQADGSVVGIEIEILKLICKELNVELKIEQVDFESVLPGVQAGKYDVGVSGISVTDGRKKNTLFTDPYCLAAQSIVVVEGSKITGKADLDGKKISVQTATTAEEFCMKNGYDVQSFSANSDAQAALTSGKVAAWVIDDLTAAEMVEAYNAAAGDKAKLVILDEAMTTEPYAFAFSFGSEEVVAKINDILKNLVSDGTVAGIFEQFNAPYTKP